MTYDPSTTIAGQLQRGLGRGAVEARDAAAVYACVRHDHRWWWSLDERAVYLARLIRDLGLSVAPLTDRLHAPDPDDDNHEFTNTLEVLEVLGRAGVDGVVDEVRRYVAEGPRWQEVLETVARRWPVELWDDLLPVVRERVDGLVFGQPWERWAARDPALPLGVPDPGALTTFLAGLPAGPPRWQWFRFVAEHGDESDVPQVLDGIAWLDDRADRCGYDVLVTGLARIGGPATAGLPKLLRRLGLTPHSYERASYLRAYLEVDAARAELALREGLWDCEGEVRLLAAQRVSLTPRVRRRLTYLRDDPIEAPGVRATAAARL
jgi:ribosomal protein S28E/S33